MTDWGMLMLSKEGREEYRKWVESAARLDFNKSLEEFKKDLQEFEDRWEKIYVDNGDARVGENS
ncbi:MAG: hypothetical protein ACXABY_23120 [Candidatus Thorarchaeota archaeon]|jgi:hypothetical protein